MCSYAEWRMASLGHDRSLTPGRRKSLNYCGLHTSLVLAIAFLLLLDAGGFLDYRSLHTKIDLVTTLPLLLNEESLRTTLLQSIYDHGLLRRILKGEEECYAGSLGSNVA